MQLFSALTFLPATPCRLHQEHAAPVGGPGTAGLTPRCVQTKEIMALDPKDFNAYVHADDLVVT